jgi:ribonucleoside-diphosphate reductase alpha chain
MTRPGTEFLWRARYRDESARPQEKEIADTWRRVARSVASVEKEPDLWSTRFYDILRDFRFLPGGRILAGAGTTRRVTLFNCFVMGVIEDSLPGIFEALKEGAITLQQGGGVGYDFSTLRPHGARALDSGSFASGPVSFLKVWDVTCAAIQSTGPRGGAMMATLRCDHPDIEAFIDAKRAPGALPHFTLSVLITDAFMNAVKHDLEWPLLFPEDATRSPHDTQTAYLKRKWSGGDKLVSCRVWRIIRARNLWERLCASAHECAEPGVLFIDQINSENNLGYCETLSATNPCAEEPLPPYGACNLGSLNLTAFVLNPFTPEACFDDEGLRATTRTAVRFLDDVIDLSRFPLVRQCEQVHRTRRLGLGITGLADALAMSGRRYDSDSARLAAADLVKGIRNAAYEASVELAKEKGRFPAFLADSYLREPFTARLPEDIRAGIRTHGLRNSHLLAIAPAGAISRLAGNISTGIEPLALTPAVAPHDQLLMQAAVQPYIDGSISKTVVLPAGFTQEELSATLLEAYQLQLKGCTVFRAGSRPEAL